MFLHISEYKRKKKAYMYSKMCAQLFAYKYVVVVFTIPVMINSS